MNLVPCSLRYPGAGQRRRPARRAATTAGHALGLAALLAIGMRPGPALAAPGTAAPAAPAAPTAPAPVRAAPSPPPVGAPARAGGPTIPDAGAGAGAAIAQLPPPRPLDDVLRDNVKALGGADAMSKHRSLHTKMAITFQGLGITGTAERYAAAGDRTLVVTSIPNLASTREGTDGHRAWSQDPINGLRVLTEVEAEQARLDAAWNSDLRLKELYATIEVKNEPGEGGAPYLECLVLTPKAAPAVTDCHDPRTHLLVRQRGVRSSPQGNTPFLARVRDWRPVGDTKMPFVTEMQVGPLSFVGTVTTAELDVPVDASMFAVPEVPGSPGGVGSGGSGGSGAARSRKEAPKEASKKAARPPGSAAARPAAAPAPRATP